jgi:hypothetical protein
MGHSRCVSFPPAEEFKLQQVGKIQGAFGALLRCGSLPAGRWSQARLVEKSRTLHPRIALIYVNEIYAVSHNKTLVEKKFQRDCST